MVYSASYLSGSSLKRRDGLPWDYDASDAALTPGSCKECVTNHTATYCYSITSLYTASQGSRMMLSPQTRHRGSVVCSRSTTWTKLTGQHHRDTLRPSGERCQNTGFLFLCIPAVGITAALVAAVVLFWANYRNPLLEQCAVQLQTRTETALKFSLW